MVGIFCLEENDFLWPKTHAKWGKSWKNTHSNALDVCLELEEFGKHDHHGGKCILTYFKKKYITHIYKSVDVLFKTTVTVTNLWDSLISWKWCIRINSPPRVKKDQKPKTKVKTRQRGPFGVTLSDIHSWHEWSSMFVAKSLHLVGHFCRTNFVQGVGAPLGGEGEHQESPAETLGTQSSAIWSWYIKSRCRHSSLSELDGMLCRWCFEGCFHSI